MARCLIVWGAVGFRQEAVLVAASALFVAAALLTAGLVGSLYMLTEDMLTPPSGPSGYYVVVTSYSVAPFTSVIREGFVEERLGDVHGVVDVVYEVLAPVVIGRSVYVLRGVEARDLGTVAGEYAVIGEGLGDRCVGCVLVGEALARELGVGPNDTLVVYSPMASSDFVLIVKGVLVTNTVLRYELVTNVPTAEAVRGIGPGAYSLAIVFTDGPASLRRVAEAFNVSLAGRGLLERAFLALRIVGPRFRPYFLESLSDMYLSRFGLSRDMLVSVLIGTVGVLSIGFYILGQAVALYASGRMTLLHDLGLSIRYLRLCLASFAASLTVFGAVIGLITAHVASPWVRLEVIGYVRHPVIDYVFFAASAAASTALAVAGSVSAEVVRDE